MPLIQTIIRVPGTIRAISRATRLLGVLAWAVADYWLTIQWRGHRHSPSMKARWTQRISRRILAVLAVKASYHGKRPTEGLLVSNHLSYLDILLLAADTPLIFISKAEVSGWPIFGYLTRLAGTLFIRREQRKDVVRISREMASAMESGTMCAFFPEGTSSDGARVLPFHAALFAPAIKHQWPITPAAICYQLEPGEGSVGNDVAYCGDMTFGPHLLGLLRKSQIKAIVRYGTSEPPGNNRRELSTRLHDKIKEALIQ